MTLRGFAFGSLLLLTAFGSARAAAQTQAPGDVDEGRNHFDRGVEYVEDGDLRAAAIEFKRAYAASPNYRVLYNLGQVCNELREYTEAQSYLQRYLNDGGAEIDAARKREVEGMLSKLAGRIATLVLSSNMAGAELFVDNVSVGTSPLSESVAVSTGTRLISAAIRGRSRVTKFVEAAGGETLVVRLDFPASAPEAVHAGQRSAQESGVKHEGPGLALWLGIGTGVLAAGTGVMAYLAAHDAAKYHDALHRQTTPGELDDLDKRASAKALVSDILLGTTVAAAAVTVIVALQGEGKHDVAPSHDARARARLSVGAGALGLSGGF